MKLLVKLSQGYIDTMQMLFVPARHHRRQTVSFTLNAILLLPPAKDEQLHS